MPQTPCLLVAADDRSAPAMPSLLLPQTVIGWLRSRTSASMKATATAL
jgi:hypothetical protein